MRFERVFCALDFPQIGLGTIPSPIEPITAPAEPSSELIRIVIMIDLQVRSFAATFTLYVCFVIVLVIIEPLPLLIVADAATSELAIAAMS